MKRWLSVLVIAALAMGTWSCRKNETPRQHDPNVDAPASVFKIEHDSGLIADQRKIAAAAKEEAPTSTHPPTTNGHTTPASPTTGPAAPITPTTEPATSTTPATGPAGDTRKTGPSAVAK